MIRQLDDITRKTTLLAIIRKTSPITLGDLEKVAYFYQKLFPGEYYNFNITPSGPNNTVIKKELLGMTTDLKANTNAYIYRNDDQLGLTRRGGSQLDIVKQRLPEANKRIDDLYAFLEGFRTSDRIEVLSLADVVVSMGKPQNKAQADKGARVSEYLDKYDDELVDEAFDYLHEQLYAY